MAGSDSKGGGKDRRRSRRAAPSAETESAALGKPLPHNIDAERSLLAACMRENAREVITDCINQKVTRDSFHRPAHQLIFDAILELYQENVETDEITLEDKLLSMGFLEEVGGRATINSISDSIQSSAFAGSWMRIVKSKHLLRRLIRLSSVTIERCFEEQGEIEEFLAEVEEEVFRIGEAQISDAARIIKDPLDKVIKMIHEMADRKDSSLGLRTGFTDLDKYTLGFHPQEMIVLAARPSVGKTAFAMNIAEAAGIAGPQNPQASSVLVFSLEMSSEQLAQRILCSRARVNMNRVRENFISREEASRISEAAGEIGKASIFIDDQGGLNILEVRAKARRLAAQEKGRLGLVVIDYLQLINGMDSRAPRENQIAEISRGIKAMAKELNVPVLVLSQLNRESEKEKREPRMSDLRESGAIEQDADVVLILHRPKTGEDGEERPTELEKIRLILAKQRNGPTGAIDLAFRRAYTRFENFIETHGEGFG